MPLGFSCCCQFALRCRSADRMWGLGGCCPVFSQDPGLCSGEAKEWGTWL